jgi:hypothetical protein
MAAGAGVAMLLAFGACQPPFNLGQPTTRALETGAVGSLTSAASLEIKGAYTESGDQSGLPSQPASSVRIDLAGASVGIDLQLVRPTTEHVVVTGADVNLEAIVIGGTAYFRGQQFLAQHMGDDPLSRSLVQAAGNAWWKGSAAMVPRLPHFTDGTAFQSTFLGPAVTDRIEHASVDGMNAVDLSGPRADVFIAADAPYRLLRVHLKKGVAIDGVRDGDLKFQNFNQDFRIAAPTDVIDFSNLSTLPPIYTVVSVDTSGCGSPCIVSALLKNLGGVSGAKAPSTITFTMTDSASGRVLGTCQAQVIPDVGYNATTTVKCIITSSAGQAFNAAIVTASADNPGRA